MTDLLVPPDEIERLTGYKRPSRQVDELRRRGFHRARRNHAGQVILERAHYDAVKRLAVEAAERLEWDRPQREAREAKAAMYRAQEAQEARERAEQAAASEADRPRREAVAKERKRVISLFHANNRRATVINRTPAWADLEAIRAIYFEAAERSRETGEPHHVDHIVPLNGYRVSGLHVHQNLQIITRTENLRKGANFEVSNV